jgi:hypothetical protein
MLMEDKKNQPDTGAIGISGNAMRGTPPGAPSVALRF